MKELIRPPRTPDDVERFLIDVCSLLNQIHNGLRAVYGAKITGLPEYADNAAAVAGGLTTGQVYRTAAGVLMVVI